MDTIDFILGIIISVPAGILAGISNIYTFNRIPAKWLCDYGQEPDKEMWGVRIRKKPWVVVFSLVFTASFIMMMDEGYMYCIAGFVALWLLLQIGIADKKYMIIPDQHIIALAVTAIGLIPFQASYLSPLSGALIGGGSFFMIGLLGQMFFKKEAMGFGDVKLLAAIGLMFGTKGILIIILLTLFSSAFIFGTALLAKKIKSGDEQPLGPFIAGSTAVYIIFNYEINAVVNMYLSFF